MSLLEGKSPAEKLRTSYVPVLQKNWMLWPAVQAVNFTYVPLHHRVLVVNVVSLGWNCYLSYANSQGGSEAAEAAGDETVGDVEREVKKEL